MTNPFLTAEWRKLIMVQYEVDPASLARLLPRGTELDLFDGQCFVSLVGFLFERVRVKGVAVPFHMRFEEVNLRFYVRRVDVDGTVRRGVVFIREFVPRMAITAIANILYEEPYKTLPMRYRIALTGAALDVSYEWKYGGTWHTLGVKASAKPQEIAAGSAEEFITEHYWGFTKRSRATTSQYEVQHPRWAIYPIKEQTVRVDFGALYGEEYAGLNGMAPAGILLAEGSAITVGAGTRLEEMAP